MLTPSPESLELSREIAKEIIRDVCDLPDRNSPEDWPLAMLVTGEELAAIVEERFALALDRRAERARREAADKTSLLNTLKGMGVCMSCVLNATEPCTDCLGTGWNDGDDPFARAETAEHSLAGALSVVSWCRPRLGKDCYRETLDKMLANPATPDHTPIVHAILSSPAPGGENHPPDAMIAYSSPPTSEAGNG